MAIPGNGTVLAAPSIYQLTAPGSVAAQATINSILGGLGSSLFVASPLSQGSPATFTTATVGSVTTANISYPTPQGAVTIPNVTLIKEGSSGFTFSSSNGGTYFLTTLPIGGTSLDVNALASLGLFRGTLDAVVGPNATLYVGAQNTPATLDRQASFACVLRGTRIATPGGEVAVESLEIGDLVLTGRGKAKPVLWIGRRSYAGAFVGRNPELVPVRVTAGALGETIPRRDLLLSPCHAIRVDGMLVPAAELVNGTSVSQVHGLDAIDYFHVEVEGHDVIFAEGVPCETFLDQDSRMAFQNVDEYFELYPDREEDVVVSYASRILEGAALETVRERLARPADVDALKHVA